MNCDNSPEDTRKFLRVLSPLVQPVWPHVWYRLSEPRDVSCNVHCARCTNRDKQVWCTCSCLADILDFLQKQDTICSWENHTWTQNIYSQPNKQILRDADSSGSWARITVHVARLQQFLWNKFTLILIFLIYIVKEMMLPCHTHHFLNLM